MTEVVSLLLLLHLNSSGTVEHGLSSIERESAAGNRGSLNIINIIDH